MHFINFNFPTDAKEIVICSNGRDWDLHNFAKYSGMVVNPDGTVILKWDILPNPYRPQDAVFTNCELVFRNLVFLKIDGRDRDAELPESENKTIHGISRILPDSLKPYKIEKKWPLGMPFHLLFDFRGGLSIEIAAKEVEFLARNEFSAPRQKG